MSKLKKTISKTEFSKRMVILNNVAMLVALFTIIIFRPELEKLSIAITVEVITVMVSYFFKAYFGKKNEEENKVREKRYQYYFEDTETINNNFEEGEY